MNKPKSPNVKLLQSWYDNLVSGEFDQTQSCLGDANGYCCLGVLGCTINKRRMKKENDSDCILFDGEHGAFLPDKIWDRLGIEEDQSDYSEMNDSYGLTFKQIAKKIKDKYLKPKKNQRS